MRASLHVQRRAAQRKFVAPAPEARRARRPRRVSLRTCCGSLLLLRFN
jgi:hypothetical protein